jgi:predicted TIM-barrel fold metal-dependent hydrolase
MAAVQEQVPEAEQGSVVDGIMDCDVHNATRSPDVLKKYLPKRYAGLYEQGGPVGGHAGQFVGARPQPHIFRTDSVPDRATPGSDLELMREQLLDPFNISKAVLHPVLEVLMAPLSGGLSNAIMAAINDWMVDCWLDEDERLLGGISISVENGAQAAAEIARVAAHRRFVAVVLPIVTREGLGHPNYWPIYEAATNFDLPVVLHVGGFSGTQTAAGWPTYFVEHHTAYAGAYQSQVVSIVGGGVLERFPNLQIVLEEGGVAWMPALMWRLDRIWESMGDKVHDTSRRPSELVREHFWFTTQPFDEPERPQDLITLLDHLDMDDRIMFASDYPHWDFDNPTRILPARRIGEERHNRIFRTNAEVLFDLNGPGARR